MREKYRTSGEIWLLRMKAELEDLRASASLDGKQLVIDFCDEQIAEIERDLRAEAD